MRVDQNEPQLIRKAQQGDKIAFATLVNLYGTLVYNLALRTLNEPHEAEDVAQESFIRAWQALPRFRAQAQFSTWLYRITTNLCYNRLPRLKMELAALDPDELLALSDDRQGVERAMITAEMKVMVHTAVANLPQSQRLLITLRHMHGLSYAEIATITDLPLGTVKTGIYRARQQLRQILTPQLENENG